MKGKNKVQMPTDVLSSLYGRYLCADVGNFENILLELVYEFGKNGMLHMYNFVKTNYLIFVLFLKHTFHELF